MESFEPGTAIYREGEVAAEMFFITKGTVIARFKGQEIELGAQIAAAGPGLCRSHAEADRKYGAGNSISQ